MSDLKDLYKKKIANASYGDLSQFIKAEMGKGFQPVWKEIDALKKVGRTPDSPELTEQFLGLDPTTDAAKELKELTLLHTKAGYSLTEAFDQAKMMMIKLKSEHPF